MELEDIVKWGVICGLTVASLIGIQEANAETLILHEQRYDCGFEYECSKYDETTFMLDNGHVLSNYSNEGVVFALFDGRNMVYDTDGDGLFDKVEETFAPDYKSLCEHNPNYKRI